MAYEVLEPESAATGGYDVIEPEASPKRAELVRQRDELAAEHDWKGDAAYNLLYGAAHPFATASDVIGKLSAGAMNLPERGMRALGLSPSERGVFKLNFGSGESPPLQETKEPIPLPFHAGVPIVNIPGSEDNPISRLAEGFTTPESVATLPLAAEARLAKPVQAFFLSQTIPGAVESGKQALNPELSTKERVGAAVNSAANVLLTKALGDAYAGAPAITDSSPPKFSDVDLAAIRSVPPITREAVPIEAKPVEPTIGEPNAIQKQSAGEIPVRETPGDSQALAEGIRPTQEPARAQEQTAPNVQEKIVPAEVAKEIGYDFNPEPQFGGIKIEGLTPEETAKLSSVMPRQWEFTRRSENPNDPLSGNTFYVPEGASKDAILQRAAETKAAASNAKGSGIVSGSKWEAWADNKIGETQGRLFTGLDPELLTAYAIKGAAIIERGAVKFGEWSGEMLKQFGDAIKPHLEDIYRESLTTAKTPSRFDVEGDSVKMRKLSARGTQSESVPKPVQEQISNAPESFYKQQSMARVEETTKALSDAELSAVPKDSNIYTAAKLEQANRLFEGGKDAEGYQVFQDLSQELTRMGQVINQAKLLNALQPENIVKIVNEGLKKAKRDPLTPEQATRLRDLSAERIKAQRDVDNATARWMKEPTDENAASAEKTLTEANDAALDEQRMVHKFQNRSIASLLKAILQGNLLTPISQVANIVGNVNFVPFRSATRAGATLIDILDSSIRNRKRQVSVAPISGTIATAKGMAKGIKEIPSILGRGTGDVIKGEQRSGLHPMRAWATQFSKNPDAPTVAGKIPFADRVKLAIEGTLGVPAEVMLRGLGAGDIAFREAARARLISEQSRLQNLSAEQSKMAQSFPELFFNKGLLQRIENETRGAIFQRHSATLDHVMSWMKGKGDLFDLLVSTVAPYKLTPWNIVSEILSYNPLVAMGKAALEAKRGNIREAEMNAAKVVVGSMLAYSGYWLYKNGLLAPSMDSTSEQQKARILAGEVLPPNHINVSGLKRALEGGDPAFKPGDDTRDIFRAGGLAGSMFYMAANVGRDMETKPEADQAILSVLKNSTLEQARFGLNQSFLKGVTGLLDAVRDGDADPYLQSYANTVLSIPLPNTLSAISRAERKYKVDTKGDTLGKQLENAVRTRLGFAGLDDYLPLKRGLWGEPLTETPKDRNALIYNFFDITKGQQVTDNPVPLELYRLWRKTADTTIIPTPPTKIFTHAKTSYALSPEQQSRLAELIGNARLEKVNRLVINPNWHSRNDEEKIRILQTAYDLGSRIGKHEFWMESDGKLKEKPGRAGFK